ncbi:MAG TPA: glycosyltransferase [Thermoanaerobaculia bacterium]|jgi:spore maturation protein CgeB
MKIVLFCHSLASDWNHGNAHFLRGVVWELRRLGHSVQVYEPRDSWSMRNLLADHGEEAVRGFHRAYPGLITHRYDLATLDVDLVLDGAELVLAHEWNSPELIRRLGEHRAKARSYRLFFHDTHHRSVSDPAAMADYDLRHYDGALVFGEAIRERYLAEGWAARVWTWHEAADVRRFGPMNAAGEPLDLVWIGNWGDDERTHELREFLIEPVASLHLRSVVHGVRYPDDAKQLLAASGIDYRGFLPNYLVPQTFARARVTVHVPRRFYVRALRGIPTIRVFEALACGIPLVSAPWSDSEGLFREGDYLKAKDGAAMKRHLRAVLHDDAMARELARRGRATILERHTCAHRVEELLRIDDSLQPAAKPLPMHAAAAAEVRA